MQNDNGRLQGVANAIARGFRAGRLRPARSPSLSQGRTLHAELIEIGVVLARVIIEFSHRWAKSLHGLAIEVDLRLVGLRQQRQDLVVLELDVGKIGLRPLDQLWTQQEV